MGIDFSNDLVKLKTTCVVCSSVAIVTTVTRLYVQRKRLWWDDGCAFFSSLYVCVQIAGEFMHVSNPDELSKTSRVAAYYIVAASFYAIIWSARLAILLSIVRIELLPTHQHLLRMIGTTFVICAVTLIGQLFWVCEPKGPTWKNEPSPQCKLTTQVAILQIVTDVVSDIFLCVWPLRIFSGLQNWRLKRRLKAIFCTSIITTVVSLVHVGYLLTIGGVNLLIVAVVEDTVSLIVANVPILFAATLRAYKVFGSATDIDLEDVELGEGVTFTLNMASLRFQSHLPQPKDSRGAGISIPQGVGLSVGTAESASSRATTATLTGSLTAHPPPSDSVTAAKPDEVGGS